MGRDAELPELATERLILRPTRAGDIGALARILNEPEVRAWWGDYDAERVRAETDEVDAWTIVVSDEVAGWLQVHEEREADYPSVAFDIVLGAGARGIGLGPDALRLAARHFIARGHHRFTIDPATANEPAIRAYAAVGFKPVGVLREAERAPAGSWRDVLLMDLLADELIDG